MKFLAVFLIGSVCSGQYVSAEACRSCHPAEYGLQSRSEHARALAPSAPGQPGDWAFGAGNQAITFVSRLNDSDYLEHGETWYTTTKQFDITPGHADKQGVRYRVFDPSAGILRCFSCHSTGPLQVTSNGTIQPHEIGVRCEVCHGPGGAHAANPAKVKLKKPGAISGEMKGAEMNTACGACHRVLSSAEDGSNLLDPWNSRHQPLLLAASVCFQKSAGQLTCIACHSPHGPLEVKKESYNSACANCHATPRHKSSVEGQACSECHMPSVKINERLAFANHRIGIYAPGNALAPVTSPNH
jgi:hypothetical protein